MVGDYEGADAQLQRTRAHIERTSGRDHPTFAFYLADAANLALVRGRLDEAITLSEQAVALGDRLFGDRRMLLQVSLDTLNVALRATGRLREALRVANRLLQIATLGGDAASVCTGLVAVGATHLEAHRLDEALPPLERARALAERNAGIHDPNYLKASIHLAAVYVERHRIAKARAACEAAIRGATPGDAWAAMDNEHCLARVEEAEGAFEPALGRLRLLVAADERRHVSEAPWGLGEDRVAIGRLLARLGRRDEAIALLERVLAGEPTPRTGVNDVMVEARLRLAQAIVGPDRARAETLITEALDLLSRQEARDPALEAELHRFVAARALSTGPRRTR